MTNQRLKEVTFSCYLRNRKHVPCFYQVIETRMEISEMLWERKLQASYPKQVIPKVHNCMYFDTNTQNICSLFLLENTATKRKTTCLLWLSKCQFFVCTMVTCMSSAHASSVFLKTWLLTNQCAYFLGAVL